VSFEALRAVFDLLECPDAGLKPSERLVLLALANHVNKERGGLAWPGTVRLARMTGLDRRTVQRALASLVNAYGLVQRELGGGRGQSSRYRLRLPSQNAAPRRPSGQAAANERAAPCRGGAAPRSQRAAPRRENGGSTPPDPGIRSGYDPVRDPEATAQKKRLGEPGEPHSGNEAAPVPMRGALREVLKRLEAKIAAGRGA